MKGQGRGAGDPWVGLKVPEKPEPEGRDARKTAMLRYQISLAGGDRPERRCRRETNKKSTRDAARMQRTSRIKCLGSEYRVNKK